LQTLTPDIGRELGITLTIIHSWEQRLLINILHRLPDNFLQDLLLPDFLSLLLLLDLLLQLLLDSPQCLSLLHQLSPGLCHLTLLEDLSAS